MGNQQGRQSNEWNAGLDWFGGFFDGEGHIRLQQQRTGSGVVCCPVSSIGNTDPEAIALMDRILKQAHVGHYIHERKQKPNQKRFWLMSVSGQKRNRAFLELMLPHLRLKRDRATVALAFIYSRLLWGNGNRPYNEFEQHCFHVMNRLNKTGPSETNTPDLTNEVRMIESELLRKLERLDGDTGLLAIGQSEK